MQTRRNPQRNGQHDTRYQHRNTDLNRQALFPRQFLQPILLFGLCQRLRLSSSPAPLALLSIVLLCGIPLLLGNSWGYIAELKVTNVNVQ